MTHDATEADPRLRWREVVSVVRSEAPLVHCLTATVSMGLVADGLLAAGARPMMTETRAEVALGPCVIRGNASEVLVLAASGEGGRGADSTASSDAAAGPAGELARRTGAVVAVSGAVDVVTDGLTTATLAGGTPLLTRVTGTGCLLGALTAACAAVTDPLSAAIAASTWLKSAGAQAAQHAAGPGTFRVQLLDALDTVAR